MTMSTLCIPPSPTITEDLPAAVVVMGRRPAHLCVVRVRKEARSRRAKMNGREGEARATLDDELRTTNYTYSTPYLPA